MVFVAQGTLDESQLARRCEQQYNNRALVPDHPEILGRWITEAKAYKDAAVRAGRADVDLPYLDAGVGGTERTSLDVFWPSDAARADCPIAMFVHGGYWHSGDRTAVSHLARGANEMGVAVAIPSYDLCPEVTIGTIIDQIASACSWLWRHVGRRMVVGGHSAGGHLAAVMLTEDFARRDPTAPTDLVPCAMPISGLFDLRDLVYASSVNERVGLDIREATMWSPLLGSDPPPKRIVHAVVGADESDAFHWQSRTLVDRWAQAEVDTSLCVADGNHFTVLEPLTRPHSELTQRLVHLARHALVHV